MRLPSRKFISVSLATTALLAAISLSTAQQASATTYLDGNTNPATSQDYFTLTYNSNGLGAQSYFYNDIPNYAGPSAGYVYVFAAVAGDSNAQAGAGVPTKNNAAWGSNNSTTDSYTIYYSSNYNGPAQLYTPEYYGTTSYGNLDASLHNNEASQYERYYA